MAGYTQTVYLPVTHPISNRVQCRLTSISQRANHYTTPSPVLSNCYRSFLTAICLFWFNKD